eukprot:8892459-Pyramimonas_sp.AAC.1
MPSCRTLTSIVPRIWSACPWSWLRRVLAWPDQGCGVGRADPVVGSLADLGGGAPDVVTGHPAPPL